MFSDCHNYLVHAHAQLFCSRFDNTLISLVWYQLVVVEDHKPLFVDEWELIQKVQKIGEDMLARTGVSYPSRWPVV